MSQNRPQVWYVHPSELSLCLLQPNVHLNSHLGLKNVVYGVSQYTWLYIHYISLYNDRPQICRIMFYQVLKSETQHRLKNLLFESNTRPISVIWKKSSKQSNWKENHENHAISIGKLIILPAPSHHDMWLFDWWVEHCQYWLTGLSLSANYINKHPGMTAYWKPDRAQSQMPAVTVEVWWNILCLQKSNDMPASLHHTHIPILTETLSKLTAESNAHQ